MIFTETRLAGAYVIEIERHEDERGFFARTFCAREFGERGLATRFVNTNLSRTLSKGTLRGLHYQVPPDAEAKLVRCTRGAIWDAVVDLRPDSPTAGEWVGVELSRDSGRMVYVPEGFAHGFLTLTDDVEAVYQISAFYAPESERGLRWDDPAIGIEWPAPVRIVSEKDRAWPPYAGGVRAG